MKPALVLIDLQHDFLRATGSGEIVARAAALLQQSRAAGIPIIHVWTTVHREPDRRMPHWQRDGKWICVAGTPGHATPLPPVPGEPILHKTFFSAFAGTNLAALLAELGVDTLRLAGVQTQSCIRATAVDAYQHGLQVELTVVGSDDPLHAAMSRRYLEARVTNPPAQKLTVPATDRTWRQSSLETRIAMLNKLAARIDVPAWAELITAEVRKPARYARAEVERAIALVKAATRIEPLEAACGPRSMLRYRPRGVIAVITPWNNPLAIPLGKIAPALAYGNTVVWKPSPLAARIADRLVALIEPRGLVTVVHGDGATAEELMADERVDAVALTGSEAAGFAAQVICAQRHIPLQAELGGNNAAMVLADADVPAAAAAIAEGAFGFAGQRCTANRRAVVERACLAEFLEHLRRHAGEVGPVISAAKREQIAALVARAGGVLFQGPGSADPAVHPATVILSDDPASEIVQEETFGPVLVVQPADDFDHALRLSNEVRQGLVAALFSRSAARQRQFLDEAQAGILKLNLATADADVEAPFGGWKASGIGPPEHGRSNREVYTRTQAVYR